jgi:hypothetical protein
MKEILAAGQNPLLHRTPHRWLAIPSLQLITLTVDADNYLSNYTGSKGQLQVVVYQENLSPQDYIMINRLAL